MWSREALITYLYGEYAEVQNLDGVQAAVSVAVQALLYNEGTPAGLFRSGENDGLSAIVFSNGCTIAKFGRVVQTMSGIDYGFTRTRNQPLGGFDEAVGAFCMSGALMLALALVPRIARYIEKIPASLSSAMLAGVLLSLAKSFVPAFETYPLIVGLVSGIWLLLFIYKPLVALPVALGVLFAYFLCQPAVQPFVAASVHGVEFVAPVFTLSSFINLSIPLFVVTLFSQNIPGYLISRNNGYATHFPGALFVTGLATSCASLFGCHNLNLAALTAAMCAGPLASHDKSLRYIASCAAGGTYLVMAWFAAGLVSLLSVIPSQVILALAALALFSTLADALRDSLKTELYYPTVATLMITVYFPNFFHVSSSFWGLLLGTLFYLIYNKKRLG